MLPSISHYLSHSSSLLLTANLHPSTSTTSTLPLALSLNGPSNPSSKPFSKPQKNTNFRRPKPLKPLILKPQEAGTRSDATTAASQPKTSRNPLRNLVDPPTVDPSPHLTAKLWLTSKLSPPPPPPPELPLPSPRQVAPLQHEEEAPGVSGPDDSPPVAEFRQEGKIFVGNLPLWIKKNQVAEFFRQFGPIKNVILIKGYEDAERNVGFGFVIYGGPIAAKSAMKAVEFDGVEFHGRVLTVKLDDGRRLKARQDGRLRWVDGCDEVEYRSKWHEEREGSRNDLRRVLESQPENWQAVVRAFEKIKKPSRKEFGLMVNYYARRGDMHRAREAFESMRARGIEPTSHVYTSLIHAYAVARDMEEALSCVRKMKEEGVEMSLVTYSIIVGGFAKTGNVEAADHWFDEARMRHPALNAIIYGSIIYAHCQTRNMDRAEALVREMEQEGIDAPIDIYHTMMDGYTISRQEDKCLVVFERLKECGFTPSIITFGCLINLYTKVFNPLDFNNNL